MPPTYDYECQACEHRFEEFQSMSDPLLVKCPECGKRRLKRLLGTGAGIIFKGSGFYETDYRRKTGTPPAKKEGESKPESKPESGGAKPEPGAPKSDSGRARSDSAKRDTRKKG